MIWNDDTEKTTGIIREEKYGISKITYVEIVRCKDCKYHDEEDGKNFCDCGNRPDDWFCADGIRKEGN